MVNPQFDWESFESPGAQSNQEENFQSQEVNKEKPQEENFQWGNYLSPETYQGEPNPEEEENAFGYIMRNTLTNASRLLEQGFGRYGNIEKFTKDALVSAPKTGGIIGWAVSELLGPENWEKLIRGSSHQQILPTSQQLKELSEKSTGGYTKAKTKGEESFQEFTEDVGAMFLGPRGRNLTNAPPLQRAREYAYNKFLIPAAANVTKELVDYLGFGKDLANRAKMAVWLPLSLIANISAPQYASNLMNQGRNGIPNNLNFNVPRLQNRLQQVANNPHLLHADPRSALARQELANIERDLAQGQTSVRSLMTTYDGINAAKRNRDLFSLNRNDQAFARRSIDQVRDAVRDEIMDAGAAHPQALNSWRNGIQAWSVIHQSRALTNWIDGLARGPYGKILTGPVAGLFGISSYAGYKVPMVGGPVSVGVPAAYKTFQTMYRIIQDPNLGRYYWNAIGDAMNENAPAFINNYLKLNKEIEKSDSTKKKTKTKK